MPKPATRFLFNEKRLLCPDEWSDVAAMLHRVDFGSCIEPLSLKVQIGLAERSQDDWPRMLDISGYYTWRRYRYPGKLGKGRKKAVAAQTLAPKGDLRGVDAVTSTGSSND